MTNIDSITLHPEMLNREPAYVVSQYGRFEYFRYQGINSTRVYYGLTARGRDAAIAEVEALGYRAIYRSR